MKWILIFFSFGHQISVNMTGNFNYTCTYTTKLSNHGSHLWIVQRDISVIILQVQEYRLLWDKAQSDYKDHKLKTVTWNNIWKSVELLVLCHIIHAFS